jgi:hypothetical protein
MGELKSGLNVFISTYITLSGMPKTVMLRLPSREKIAVTDLPSMVFGITSIVALPLYPVMFTPPPEDVV